MGTMTGMTVIAMVTRVTEMSGMARISGTTSFTGISNNAAKRTAHEHKCNIRSDFHF